MSVHGEFQRYVERVIDALRETLRLDPDHVAASEAPIRGLVELGERGEANDLAQQCMLMSPDASDRVGRLVAELGIDAVG